MIIGSHLLRETPSGVVDASLGRFGLLGKGAASVAAGEQVEVTGVMKMINDKQVFLAPTVRVGDPIYTSGPISSIPGSPQARERASQKTDSKGESL
jgi:hypothetical protein